MLWWDDDVKKNQVKPPDIDSKILNSRPFFHPTWSSFPPFFCPLLLSWWNNSDRKLGWINFCWIKVQSLHNLVTYCTDSLTQSKKFWDLIDVTLSDRNAFSKVGANKTNYSSFLVMVMVWSVLEKNFSSGWLERSQQSLSYICTGPFSHGDKRTSKRSTSWT